MRFTAPLTPFEQFEINPLFSISTSFSFTNSSLFTLIVVSILTFFFYLATHKSSVVPNAWQGALEMLYEFVSGLVYGQIGVKGYKYLPLIFTTFTFILGCNMLGMIPYTFTVTSHLIITLGLAMSIFIGVNIIAGNQHGWHFFSFFLPQGVSLTLAPFLVLIEVISYLFRVVSLAVRLFANMMSGHALLKILAGFSWTMSSKGGLIFVASIVPLAIVFILTGLELAIAFLQAYVFSVLVCIYLNDAIHLH